MELNKKPFDRDFEVIYKNNRILVRNEGPDGERLIVNSVLQDLNSEPNNGKLQGFLINSKGEREQIEVLLGGTDSLECYISINDKLIYSSNEMQETKYVRRKRERQSDKKNKNILMLPFIAIIVVCVFTALMIPFINKQLKQNNVLKPNIENNSSSNEINGNSDDEKKWIDVTYSWNYNNYNWSYSLKISQKAYSYYQNVDRKQIKDYSFYVKDASDDKYLAELATKFKEAAEKENYSDLDMVKNIIYFVQNLEYVDDKIGTGYDEYPKFPLETLADQGGDCEDSAILLASLLRELGYGAVLFQFRDHMAVGVKGEESIPGSYFEYKGVRYYYVETTSRGWDIGEVPSEIKNETAKILLLN